MASAVIGNRIQSFFLYGEMPRAREERMLHVETIAARSARHDWKIRPHVHRTLHQLLFSAAGRGVALVEDAAARYRSPALIVVPAGTVHGFEFDPDTEGFVVSVSCDLLHDIVRREPGVGTLFESPVALECRREAVRVVDLAQSFALFAREVPCSGPGRALALEGWLGVILGKVLRLTGRTSESPDAAFQRRRALVARFRDLIDRELGKSRSVAEYAAALNVSESRLRQTCLSVTEQSPIQLVHARILLEAKRQLLYTSKPVSEIAYALGFDDPAYFTRFFSQRTGMSPRAFRARGPIS